MLPGQHSDQIIYTYALWNMTTAYKYTCIEQLFTELWLQSYKDIQEQAEQKPDQTCTLILQAYMYR